MPRHELEIFKELESLCQQTGFIHAVAYFCLRDNAVGYNDSFSGKNLETLYRPERLIRTEISILIGLLGKTAISLEFPNPEAFVVQINRTEELLREFHDALNYDGFSSLNIDEIASGKNPSQNAALLRESIFYANESAYPFQYLSLAKERYANDEKWISDNNGFAINDSEAIINAVLGRINYNVNQFNDAVRKDPRCAPSAHMFMVYLDEITRDSGISANTIRNFMRSFEFVPNEIHNKSFNGFSDYNETNAKPFIKVTDDSWLLFQVYSILESLYESPPFWMAKDKTYNSIATINRGKYLENITKKFMVKIFGENRVFSNLDLYKGKDKIGEIDVFVIYANRALIFQCKSKKLTIKARMGHSETIGSDFSKAVQDSYNQCVTCADALLSQGVDIKYENGDIFALEREISEIFPICLLSEHYPSLAFQSANFLKLQTRNKIKNPFVMDIFTLDTIVEFLDNPLLFLSYIIRRSQYWNRISSGHELTNLAFHLRQNMFFENEDFIYIGDEISSDLDAAMAVRRLGLPGEDTPEGILTKFKDTFLWKLINEISSSEAEGALDIGLELLSFSGDSIRRISLGVMATISNARKNGHSDLTIPFDATRSGFTIHCNNIRQDEAQRKLYDHIGYRMDACCANTWIGICIDPESEKIRFGIKLTNPNPKPLSNRNDDLLKSMMKSPIQFALESGIISSDLKRNDPCYCGSGRKFKKCCMKIHNKPT